MLHVIVNGAKRSEESHRVLASIRPMGILRRSSRFASSAPQNDMTGSISLTVAQPEPTCLLRRKN
jgi:hypothetical protein